MRETTALRTARQNETDPYKRRFTVAKWNRIVTVLDVPKLFARLPEFADWTKARHEQVSRDYLSQAIASLAVYQGAVSRYLQVYGDHGPLISGVVRDHFPDDIKQALRAVAHRTSDLWGMSLAHWQAAGKRVSTWRELRDSLQN